MRTYEIEGRRCVSLEAFFEEISRVLIPGAHWGHNLDAFNDILRGGFGTPEEGFILRWRHSEESRRHLSYPETVRQLELRLGRCHPSNRETVRVYLDEARAGVGLTVFDWLVEIIQCHSAGGTEAQDSVELRLE